MSNEKPSKKEIAKSEGTPLYASESAEALGTNASGKTVSSKPKKN